MIPYSSTSGKKSGVSAYENGNDYIIVQFNAWLYKYSYRSCGQSATETMKRLAVASGGLSTFIAQQKPDYEWSR